VGDAHLPGAITEKGAVTYGYQGAARSWPRLELHPADAQAHNNRGLTKVMLEDFEGARVDFERALQLEPAMTEAKQNLDALKASRDSSQRNDDRPR
jgi:Flp pilus assembly protein TadD